MHAMASPTQAAGRLPGCDAAPMIHIHERPYRPTQQTRPAHQLTTQDAATFPTRNYTAKSLYQTRTDECCDFVSVTATNTVVLCDGEMNCGSQLLRVDTH